MAVWVIDTCQVLMPRAHRQRGGPAGDNQAGAPPSWRSTSTSAHWKAPSPTPRAFMTASLAAKRPARVGTGSDQTGRVASLTCREYPVGQGWTPAQHLGETGEVDRVDPEPQQGAGHRPPATSVR